MAPIRVAINGFGRIGRLVTRIMLGQKDTFQIVAIHDIASAKTLAHLFKYDSTFRTYPGEVSVKDDTMIIDGMTIKILDDKVDPPALPWKTMNIDFVVESTGRYRERKGYGGHIEAGAKKVLLTVPAKDAVDATIVLGVNDKELKKEHLCISNASCTTNCLAPFTKVINDTFGIEKGLMTTVHAYTNDQRILDMVHDDLRRARSAAVNIIPTSTGAAKAIGLVVPELKGKLDGFALRVPTITGSLVDLTLILKKEATKAEINAAVKAAAQGPMKGYLGYTEDPIVSTDIIGCSFSSLFDGLSTMVNGNLVKVVSWYDNEYGYSCRVCDLIKLSASL